MNDILSRNLEGVSSVVLLGHQHPDGDCIGSVLGLWNYLRENRPELEAVVYLDSPSRKFAYLSGFDRIRRACDEDRTFDLAISLDSSDRERLGDFGIYFDHASRTLCLDHHRTNQGFAGENLVVPEASSCAEVLFECLREDGISRETAECLYTGIIHDTGVFKYSSTSKRTMEIAGILMDKGINYSSIIDDSFYRKTFAQNKLLGCALLKSRLVLDGRCIISSISAGNMEDYGADSNDVDGLIDQLRITEGIECAALLYEKAPGEVKVSLRSNRYLDVSRVAQIFGGGGHIRAAGCTLQDDLESAQDEILLAVAAEMQSAEPDETPDAAGDHAGKQRTE